MATIPSPYQTTDDLVTAVLRNTSQPNNQQTFTSDDILALLNEEMRVTLTNIVQAAREDYWVFYADTVIQAGVSVYTIPVRSVMAAVDDIVMVNTEGIEIELPMLDQQQKKVGPFYSYVPATLLRGVYFRNDTINTWPLTMQLPIGYSIRVKYLRRPNSLTGTVNCARINAINTGTNTVTCDAVPTAWPAGGGTVLDIIDNNPQFSAVQDGITITSISGFNVVLPSLPTGLAVGQWLCPTGTTCIPQIPVESYALLANLGALRVYMSQQNANGFQTTAKIVESMAADVAQMLQPRSKGESKKIVNKNIASRWLGGPFNGSGMW